MYVFVMRRGVLVFMSLSETAREQVAAALAEPVAAVKPKPVRSAEDQTLTLSFVPTIAEDEYFLERAIIAARLTGAKTLRFGF